MLDDISLDDLTQLYRNTLMLHNNKPVFVENIISKQEWEVLDLDSQRFKEVKYDGKNILPLKRRIGFVNRGNWAFYLSRGPVRKYKNSWSKENSRIFLHDRFGRAYSQMANEVASLKVPEICDAIRNKYPSLEEAVALVITGKKAFVAFDRQFAITYDSVIWYKNEPVGFFGKGGIQFNDDRKHLQHVIGKNYEEAFSSSRTR